MTIIDKGSIPKKFIPVIPKGLGLLVAILLLVSSQMDFVQANWKNKDLLAMTASNGAGEPPPKIRVLVQKVKPSKGEPVVTVVISATDEDWLTLFSGSQTQKPLVRRPKRIKKIEININKSDNLSVSVNGRRRNIKVPHGGLLISSRSDLIVLESKRFSCFSGEPEDTGKYRGELRIVANPRGKGLLVINELGIEEYLKGVVPSEAIPSWDIEALKVQAVASRTYALREQELEKSKRRKGYYDLLDTPQSQRYTGSRCERKRTTKAVQETRGEVLTYKGKVILAMYSSNTGRHSASLKEVYPEHKGNEWEYLKSREDKFSSTATHGSWEKRIKLTELIENMSKAGLGALKDVTEIRINQKTESGRAMTVDIYHSGGVQELQVRTFLKRKLRLKDMPSDIKKTGKDIVFSGSGFGHGLGMSQWGSQKRAEAGIKYRAILAFSYVGVKIDSKW